MWLMGLSKFYHSAFSTTPVVGPSCCTAVTLTVVQTCLDFCLDLCKSLILLPTETYIKSHHHHLPKIQAWFFYFSSSVLNQGSIANQIKFRFFSLTLKDLGDLGPQICLQSPSMSPPAHSQLPADFRSAVFRLEVSTYYSLLTEILLILSLSTSSKGKPLGSSHVTPSILPARAFRVNPHWLFCLASWLAVYICPPCWV